MGTEREQLEASIAALEAQRPLLGDAVVDSALGAMRARLDGLHATERAAASRALKQVTILFMDVVGSTSISQHLDPEDTSALMDGTLKRATAIVQAHGGRVMNYAGDSVLAAFGADRAAEDDAVRAVRCGLALCALGRTVARDALLPMRDGEGFAVRVGVHTGGVLLGGDAEGAIHGINVNIAARLEQTAPPGGLRISHDTQWLVRGFFELDPQPPLAVKGVDAPLHTYLVRGENSAQARGPARGVEGVAAPMIGRDVELQMLRDAFGRFASHAGLAVVSIVGEAGIGKSRLVDEFVRWAVEQRGGVRVLRARTTPQTENRPFGLLGDLLMRHLQIADDDPPTAVRTKIEQGMAPLFAGDSRSVAEAHAHLLAHLLGIEWDAPSDVRGALQDPKQLRARAFHAASLVLRRTAERAQAGCIAVLEDLHWADDESLDFLREFIDASPDVPLLIVAIARPTLFERRPEGVATGKGLRLDLAPLDARASRALSDSLLCKLPEIPEALRGLVTDAAAGNPFFMEELVQMLLDQGAIVVAGDSWNLSAATLDAAQVPPTLTGVLQARLDGLPADERQSLQQASVIGPVFWDAALIALDARTDRTLPALVRRELVLAHLDSGLGNFAEYGFRHHLLYQVTYGTVLKSTRRELHGRVAAWLIAQADQGRLRAGDVLPIVAQHLEAAGDDLRAAEFHARAAEHAADRFAQSAALAHVGRALALLDAVATRREATPEQAALRWRLLLIREKTYSRIGHRREQRLDLQALDAIAQASGDERMRAEVALRFGLLARVEADWRTAERNTREAIRLADAIGDTAKRLQAQETLAVALRGLKQLDAAFALATDGLAQARKLGLQRSVWAFYRALALITESQGNEVASAEMEREALCVARESGDQVGEAIGLDCMGQVAILVGDLAEAQRSLEEAVQLQRQLGLRSPEAHALAYLAAVMLWRGDAENALAVARDALAVAAASGTRYAEAWARYRLGEAHLALGHHLEASASFAAAGDLARDIGIDLERTAKAGMVRAAMAQDDLDAALRYVDELIAGPQPDVASPDTTFHPELVAWTCHEVLARGGDPRAAEWLQRARALMHAVADRIPDAAQRQAHLAAMPHRRAIAACC